MPKKIDYFFRITFFSLGGLVLCFWPKLALGNEDITNISILSVKENWSGFEISWKSDPLQESESIIILRKENDCPESINDGSELYRGNGHKFLDKKIYSGETICYGVMVLDSSGRFSEIKASGQLTKKSKIEYFLAIGEENSNLMLGIGIIIILIIIHRKTMRLSKRRASIIY